MSRINLPCSVFCLLISFSFFPSDVSAQIVFDNGVGGAANIDDAFSSDLTLANVGADNFSFTENTNVTGVNWTGVYAFFNTPPASDNFVINIFDNVGGLPGSLLSSTVAGGSLSRTDSGFDEPNFGFDVYDYSVSINPFLASANTEYWISVANDTTGEDDFWLWGISNGTGDLAQSTDLGVSWSNVGHQADFQLTGATVPEPAAFGLLGVTFLLCVKRKRA